MVSKSRWFESFEGGEREYKEHDKDLPPSMCFSVVRSGGGERQLHPPEKKRVSWDWRNRLVLHWRLRNSLMICSSKVSFFRAWKSEFMINLWQVFSSLYTVFREEDILPTKYSNTAYKPCQIWPQQKEHLKPRQIYMDL